MAKRNVSFELAVSGRNDGTLEAVYIQLSQDSVARTEELQEDVLLVDYSENGKIVGIEVLAPVRLADLAQLIKEKESKKAFRRFLSASAPRELVTC